MLGKITAHKPTIYGLFTFVIMLFMFLGAADFINRYYYCVYFAFLVFILTPNRKFYINGTFLVLLVLSASMLIFNPDNHGSITNMIRPFTFPVCYFMGCNIFNKGDNEEYPLDICQKNTNLAIYLMAAGFTIHFLLNMMINMDAEDRNGIDFWSGLGMSATGQATLACLAIAIIAAFFFSNSGKFKKIIALVLLALIIAYNLVLAGRTLFVLIAVMLVLAFAYRSIALKKKVFKTVFIVLVVIALFLLIYNMDIFGIKTSFEESNFYSRFFGYDAKQQMEEDNRGQHKIEYLKRFFEYPLGGSHIRADYGHSAHDLYLDTYDESSIFALISVLAFICMSVSHGLKFIKNKVFTFETRQLVFCTYVIFNIQFWLEPIMRGMPWLFATYCFVDGVVSFVLRKNPRIRN